jgi:uncharacterized membrane protein YoaK (UPF0700 family)
MDAITYLGLGHAFPANMTGNTVLLGVAVARGDGTAGVRSAVALGGFSLGVIIGALIVGNRSWPARSASALLLESIVLLALLVGWGRPAARREPAGTRCSEARGARWACRASPLAPPAAAAWPPPT